METIVEILSAMVHNRMVSNSELETTWNAFVVEDTWWTSVEIAETIEIFLVLESTRCS